MFLIRTTQNVPYLLHVKKAFTGTDTANNNISLSLRA